MDKMLLAIAAMPLLAAQASLVAEDAIFETATLVASVRGNGDELGFDVDIDGDTIVAGAPKEPVGGPRQGAVYVFLKPVGGWVESPTESAALQRSITNPPGEFGRHVAVSGDVVVVGDPVIWRTREDGPRDYARAYVFVKPASGWSGLLTESATLRVRNGTGDGHNGNRATDFGQTVDIDGDTIVVGDPAVGKAYVFSKPAGGWSGTIYEDVRLSRPGFDPAKQI